MSTSAVTPSPVGVEAGVRVVGALLVRLPAPREEPVDEKGLEDRVTAAGAAFGQPLEVVRGSVDPISTDVAVGQPT